MRTSISCVISKAKPIDAVLFKAAASNTLRPCGLEFAEGIRSPPSQKTELPLPPVTQVTLKTRGRLRPSLLRPPFLFGAHKKGSRQAGRRESPLSCGLQTKLICILCDTGRKVSYTFPSCVPVDFPASDANPVHFPLAKYCVPCVPSGTGIKTQPPQSSSHRTTQAPMFGPQEALYSRFPPQAGERPASAWTGAGLGHTGASLAEVTGEAGKPVSFFCFSQAGNKTHRSLKPTHSSLLGRASRAPARRCRSAQKAGRSPHPLCRKERSL